MKKMIFIAGLLLSMALTAFAEQQGVFMQFHRKINPENSRDVKNAQAIKLGEIWSKPGYICRKVCKSS